MNIYFIRAERNGNLDVLSTFHLRNNAAIFDTRDYLCDYRLIDVFNNELNFPLKTHIFTRKYEAFSLLENSSWTHLLIDIARWC